MGSECSTTKCYGGDCNNSCKNAGNDRYGEDGRRKLSLTSSRRDKSSYTRVGALPQNSHRVDYFLNPHLDPNRAKRPHDRHRVWDPKTRRLSRSDQLDIASAGESLTRCPQAVGARPV
eukprot:753605-Hanusia_phi.AAC.1